MHPGIVYLYKSLGFKRVRKDDLTPSRNESGEDEESVPPFLLMFIALENKGCVKVQKETKILHINYRDKGHSKVSSFDFLLGEKLKLCYLCSGLSLSLFSYCFPFQFQFRGGQ